MTKQRNLAIEAIRGLSMLGVVGIHTGAYSLSNPAVNEHLFAILEIVTRFCVPIFFFISAFGLFMNQNLNAPFNYKTFYIRRFRSVLLPYLLWSILYMLHYSWLSGDLSIWHPPLLWEYFLFGLGSYQLYFLVILLWFYLFMPIWRIIIHKISFNPLPFLFILLLFQIAFNYYSCNLLKPNSGNYILDLFIQYRLSFLLLHYVFIFLFGAVCAIRIQDFHRFINEKQRQITASFIFTLAGMLCYFYLLLHKFNYSPEAAVNIVQQLSPPGVLYTAAASLYCYMLFSGNETPGLLQKSILVLGKYSFPIYLSHPFFMYYLNKIYIEHNIVMEVPTTIAFFIFTVFFSLLTGYLIHWIARFAPLASQLLVGSSSKTTKSEA